MWAYKMFILYLFATAAYAQDLIQVNTTEGVVQGSRAIDGNYYTFYDVPYAGPTSGESRFKAPTPALPYTGTLNATTKRNIICAQPTAEGLIGVEDCLTLSIFTKNVTTPKPVFVWINAEEYTTTTRTEYSYGNIVDRDIVFVSLNFRVSIFGFLCLRVTDAPGNAGLKDIIQGLHWVRENIDNFGGDPNNVILIGHGSGAALVDLVTLSPRSGNLVHKAIVLSGSALAPWAIAYDPIGYANLLGARLNYTSDTSQQLAALLKITDINVMASALRDFHFTNNTPLFAPCLENLELNPNETVVFDTPINILNSGNFRDIPYLAGYTSREGTLRANEAVNDQWLSRMQANFSDFLPVDVNVAANTTIIEDIRQFYFNGSTINMSSINEYLDYHGDTLVLTSVIRAARERSRNSLINVRLLEFAYIGTHNTEWPHTHIPLTGTRHGAFLNYLFNYDLVPRLDDSAMNALLNRFTTFAHTTIRTNWPLPVFWFPVTPTFVHYLHFDGEHGGQNSTFTETPKVNPHAESIAFWDNTYSKYYVAPENPMEDTDTEEPEGNSAGSVFVTITLVTLGQIYLWVM